MKHACSFLALFGLLIFSACKNGADKSGKVPKTDKAYETSALSLQETEQKYPARFLAVGGKDKKNLLGQTVIKASITNNAKMVTYKDVEIKLSFFSKTGSLLEEDVETVYESIAPGATQRFKSKYFAPRGSDSLVMKIITAKY